MQAEEGVAIKWVAFPLHPETPPQGQTLEQLFAGSGKDIPAMMERLRAAANAEGLPLGNRSMTYNSRRSQELAKWAEEQGAGPAFHAAAFRAYFADGQNLWESDVLAGLAVKAGLDGQKAIEVVESGAYAEAVDADWAYARSLGVSAVPTFAAGGRGLVGAQPYPELKRLVQAARDGGIFL
ncbi:MAG: DsbA family protein [Desulfarculaceae bacterium]|nr:DsbA family protein [Desulfarculaceae bacterium]MCF8072473.1 DsbA family protein [Desulfarculaceae bacterium]MCF8102934.1 DsbA family protein [Desulfarculaceae bacterium]MCF8117463.1 DsbA family protein [Desulfarculaceae bacterium]